MAFTAVLLPKSLPIPLGLHRRTNWIVLIICRDVLIFAFLSSAQCHRRTHFIAVFQTIYMLMTDLPTQKEVLLSEHLQGYLETESCILEPQRLTVKNKIQNITICLFGQNTPPPHCSSHWIIAIILKMFQPSVIMIFSIWMC